MTRIVAFIFSAVFCMNVFAAKLPVSSLIAPLASQSLLLDITATENNLIAVGERGHILTSTDGKTWQQAQVPLQSTLTSIFFIDNENGWAVGHDASIIRTRDGGTSWTIQQFKPELEKPLLDVAFSDINNGIAVGAYGQFYRTVDGGKNWISEFHSELLPIDDIDYLAELKAEDEEAYLDEAGSILPHFNRVLLGNETSYLVGEIGLVATSKNFGKTWQKSEEFYMGSFFDVAVTDNNEPLVVGLRGNVFSKTANDGNWNKTKTNTTALLSSIVKVNEQRLFVMGNNGVLLESHDQGRSFSLQVQDDGKALIAGVWYKNQLFAVSDVGIKNISLKSVESK